MRSPGRHLAALALAVLSVGAGGCVGDGLDPNPAEPELEPLRLGRVHVVLEPEHDPADEPFDDWDAFEVTARFAFVRGLEEDFVRARIDMPVLPSDVVAPSSCVASDQLSVAEQSESGRGELLLVDVGDLRMQIGNDAIAVPIVNVPDLLPYVMGYEYLYYAEELPSGLADEADGGGGTVVMVESQGSHSPDHGPDHGAELPAFRAEGVVPPALALHVTEGDLYELRRQALVLRWQGAAEQDDVVTLRITGLLGGEPTGAELTCVVHDVGQTRLSFDKLRPLGLRLDAEALRVTASRLEAASFDAGDFVGSELFVERRESLVLPL